MPALAICRMHQIARSSLIAKVQPATTSPLNMSSAFQPITVK